MSGDLGIRTLDLQADIAELATRVTAQAATIEAIGRDAVRLASDGGDVAGAAEDARAKAGTARAVLDDSSRQLSQATGRVVELIDQVSGIHDALGTFNTALETVGQVTAVISQIAAQTNLLALNATIEAARAGDAGRGFAVVASEVKKLAHETAAATQQIDSSIRALAGEAGGMLTRIAQGVETARTAHDGTRDIEGLVLRLGTLMRGLSDNSEAVADRIGSMVEAVSSVRTGLDALSASSTDNAAGLRRLSGRVTSVSDDTNTLLQVFATSGIEMPDTPYIRFALAVAQDVGRELEAAVADGRLEETALFSDRYVPVPGSNPPLFTHPVQSVLIAAGRPHQEAARRFAGFFGMDYTDRNTFGAVAMPERAQAQRPGQEAWNLEYARQGRFFDSGDTPAHCRMTEPFCLKAYRRLVSNGEVLLLKQVIASIHVRERHWGILQFAYEDQG